MTNTEIIATIRNEVEKRIALQSHIKGEFAEGSRDALNGLLLFIETIQQDETI